MATVETYKAKQGNTPRYTPSSAERMEGKRFYASTRWGKFRRWYLAKHPLCKHCEKQGHTKAARHIHHDKPRREFPHLAFKESNMVPLCHPCHSKEEARRRNA